MTTESDETGIGIPITGAVRKELELNPEVDASAIQVVSHDGIVRLTGTVKSASRLQAPIDVALRTPGVSTVDDQVAIGNPMELDLTDSEIAAAVDKALSSAAGIPRGSIQATVRRHSVTLTGTVEWKYQKNFADHVVSHVHGVRSIVNDITVASRLASSVTREVIRTTFTRNALNDSPAGIQKDKDNDTVILSGAVSPADGRDEAGLAAASSTHVSNIVNTLSIRLAPDSAPN